MRFFRRIASLLGIAREDDDDDDDDDGGEGSEAEDEEQSEADSPRGGGPAIKGFGVAERPGQGPIVVPCDLGVQGGVQGFKWYTKSLRIDDDGDVADEFLDEVLTREVEVPTAEQKTMLSKFQVKYKTHPTATGMRKHVFAANGNILHSFEYHGRMMLA